MAVGRPIREHHDIDVMLLRPDHLEVQRVLAGWEWWIAEVGSLQHWPRGETLPDGAHILWCRPSATANWRIEIMIDETDGHDWISRRNPGVRLPLRDIGLATADGIPILAPHVQLFYKAKDPKPKDDQDFAAVLPLLTDDQRRWLAHAVTATYGCSPWSELA
jgi:hypothetical protein